MIVRSESLDKTLLKLNNKAVKEEIYCTINRDFSQIIYKNNNANVFIKQERFRVFRET